MIRVLLVDDSTTVRRRLSALFGSALDFEVVAQAASGSEAVRWVRIVKPDLVSLDVFLPEENAAHVVRSLRVATSVPIVLVSDAPRHAPEVFEALAAGALDLLTKPPLGNAKSETAFLTQMRMLSKVRAPKARAPALPKSKRAEIMVVAASTGGPSALRDLLSGLPEDFSAPVVIAQHLAVGFEDSLVEWLTQECALEVRVMAQEHRLQAGVVWVGKPGSDIEVVSSDRVVVRPAGPGVYHPSADRLFSSAAAHFPGSAIGVILSGIGADGTKGAKDLVDSGSVVLAQDRASCAVYGMPAAAAQAGLVSRLLPPREISRQIAIMLAAGDQRPRSRS